MPPSDSDTPVAPATGSPGARATPAETAHRRTYYFLLLCAVVGLWVAHETAHYTLLSYSPPDWHYELEPLPSADRAGLTGFLVSFTQQREHSILDERNFTIRVPDAYSGWHILPDRNDDYVALKCPAEATPAQCPVSHVIVSRAGDTIVEDRVWHKHVEWEAATPSMPVVRVESPLKGNEIAHDEHGLVRRYMWATQDVTVLGLRDIVGAPCNETYVILYGNGDTYPEHCAGAALDRSSNFIIDARINVPVLPAFFLPWRLRNGDARAVADDNYDDIAKVIEVNGGADGSFYYDGVPYERVRERYDPRELYASTHMFNIRPPVWYARGDSEWALPSASACDGDDACTAEAPCAMACAVFRATPSDNIFVNSSTVRDVYDITPYALDAGHGTWSADCDLEVHGDAAYTAMNMQFYRIRIFGNVNLYQYSNVGIHKTAIHGDITITDRSQYPVPSRGTFVVDTTVVDNAFTVM